MIIEGIMPPFFPFMPVVHATFFAVIAFFVFFAASRSEGTLRRAGQVVGAWLVVLGVGVIAMAILFPFPHGGMHGFPPPPPGQGFPHPPCEKMPALVQPQAGIKP
jgi:hypothetical protein